MILLFPDLETVRLSLMSGTVPVDVTLAPATVSLDELGRIYVEPSITLSRTTTKILDRLGVKGSKKHVTQYQKKVENWLQILPLRREIGESPLSSQVPILFEIENEKDLRILVSEMLRLGNDRQSFRWFSRTDSDDDSRILLRVVGPPYYTLLRAIDRTTSASQSPIHAYIEQSPRVWVEVGYSHPLAAQIKVPDSQFVLIRSPNDWTTLDEAAFRDVYEILQFDLPTGTTEWVESRSMGKVVVGLKLTSGNSDDSAELWVLRDNAVSQLDSFVRDAEDRLVQRLMFAVASGPDETQSVILRARPSKLPPPIPPLANAIGFKPFWKLPNLFVPVGRRLHPNLRREAVRRLLASDADQVIWLYPEGSDGFTPESIPDQAFRPLEDWVEYLIEAEQEPLAAWMSSTRFDFESFICKDPSLRNKPSKPDKPDKLEREQSKLAPEAEAIGKKAVVHSSTQPVKLTPIEESKANRELKLKLKELEERFLALDGPLDDARRVDLWPQLAAANAAVGDSMAEASICWLNAIWNQSSVPEEWLSEFVRSTSHRVGGEIEVREIDFDRRLKATNPSLADSMAVVAEFLWLAARQPIPDWILAKLQIVHKFIERFESVLPVRAVWLASRRIAQLSGSDVLGLARVRDRILQRLFTDGLNAERDLPSFLRYAGLQDSDRLRMIRERSLILHKTIRDWIGADARDRNDLILRNLAYVDLLFSYSQAKLGEKSSSRKLLEDAEHEMVGSIPKLETGHASTELVKTAIVKNSLFQAFRDRIEEALAGAEQPGRASAALDAIISELAVKGRDSGVNNPYTLSEYVIRRMREQSRILEPHERRNPYSKFLGDHNLFFKELREVVELKDPTKFSERVKKLLRDGVKEMSPTAIRFPLLHAVLPLAGRVNETFAVSLLALVPEALASSSQNESIHGVESTDLSVKQGQVLERALALASHFDRREIVQSLVDDFCKLLKSKKEESRFRLANEVASQSLRSLRKLVMRDDIDRLLTRIQEEVFQGASLADLKKKYAAKPDSWAAALRTALNLASGWMIFGMNEQAAPILEEARRELFSEAKNRLPERVYPELARTYIAALGSGPVESGFAGMIELFRGMPAKRIPNSSTTAPFYSRFHLGIVQEVVLAIVGDDSTLGSAGRRWLDDDEFIIRRRIHSDLRLNLGSSGI